MKALATLTGGISAIAIASPALAQQTYSEVNVPALLTIVGVYVALIVGAILVALIPTIIAFRRKHPHRWLILVINVLFSATGIGWIIALIWSLNSLPFTDDFHGKLGTVRVEPGDKPLQVAQVPADDPADQLHRLKQLHANGVLTDAEYQSARRPLLDRLVR